MYYKDVYASAVAESLGYEPITRGLLERIRMDYDLSI